MPGAGRKCLVTGGTGLLGLNLARRLAEAGSGCTCSNSGPARVKRRTSA
jgi:NAD(P)-dependent dehydrogenase (short-subunit alcohol dehydrogenase family)